MNKPAQSREELAPTDGTKAKRTSRTKLSFEGMNVAPLPRASDGLARLQELANDTASGGQQEQPPVIRWTPGMVVVVGRQYLVPLEWLDSNPNNSRVIYKDADVDELGASLVAVGQLQAALVYAPAQPGEKFVIKEGHTRMRALHRSRLPEMRVEIVERPQDSFEDYRQSRELNLKRNNVTVFDDAVRFTQLIADDTARQIDIAQRLVVSEDYVSKVLKIGRLPVFFMERMARSREPAFGTAMAYLVAQYHELLGMDKADRLVTNIVSEKLSVRRVERLVADAKGAARGEPKAVSSTPKRLRPLSRSEVSGAARGELKLFPNGRLELELSDIDAGLRDKLYARFIRVFEEVGLDVSGMAPPRDG